MKICDFCWDKVTVLPELLWLSACMMERDYKVQSEENGKQRCNIFSFQIQEPLRSWIRPLDVEGVCIYSQGTRESRSEWCAEHCSWQPQGWENDVLEVGKGWVRECREGAVAVTSKRGRPSQCGAVRTDPRKQNQMTFGYLSFPDWENEIPSLLHLPMLSISTTSSPWSSLGEGSRVPVTPSSPFIVSGSRGRSHAPQPVSPNIVPYRLLALLPRAGVAPNPRPALPPRGTAPAPPHRYCCCCFPNRS